MYLWSLWEELSPHNVPLISVRGLSPHNVPLISVRGLSPPQCTPALCERIISPTMYPCSLWEDYLPTMYLWSLWEDYLPHNVPLLSVRGLSPHNVPLISVRDYPPQCTSDLCERIISPQCTSDLCEVSHTAESSTGRCRVKRGNCPLARRWPSLGLTKQWPLRPVVSGGLTLPDRVAAFSWGARRETRNPRVPTQHRDCNRNNKFILNLNLTFLHSKKDCKRCMCRCSWVEYCHLKRTQDIRMS